MNEYKELLNQLNDTMSRIDHYQIQIKEVQSLIEEKSNKSFDIFNEQLESIETLRSKITDYVDDYQAKFEHTSSDLSLKLRESATENIKKVISELESEVSLVLINVEKTFDEVYGNLNKSRTELIQHLEQAVDLSKNEEAHLQKLNEQIFNQNQYLSAINNESKAYIKQYFTEIASLKEELDVMKENFDLKYVYNKKRIVLTSIATLSLMFMIAVSIISAVFMFSYYSRLIFFPSRTSTLIYGILLSILGIGLISLLVLILFRPPTFIKTKRKTKIKGEFL